MKYNLKLLIDQFENGEKRDSLFFWRLEKSDSGDLSPSCFSQWWPSPFVVDGIVYKTAEHWMMAQKALLFGDDDSFEKIISAETPEKAKSLGRQVRRFNDEVWMSKRMDIVVQGTWYKFSQNNGLKRFLLNTNDKILAEASPFDKIWGIGLAADDENASNPSCWKGLNLLGFALMEVRDMLQNHEQTT